MVHIAGHLHVAAPPERVFDTVADARNEPSYNPDMSRAEKVTSGPIGTGTRFRTQIGRRGTEFLIEWTDYDRPHRLGQRTTSPMMETSGAMTFVPDGEGTRMAWDWQVRPRGSFRLLGPFVGLLGSRMERRIWTGLKHHLERGVAD